MNYENLINKHKNFLNPLMKHFGVISLNDEEINKLNEPNKTWFKWGLEGFNRAEQTFNLLKKYIDYKKNMKHLDIGCGPGYLSTIYALNDFISIGVDVGDLSHAMTNKADFPDLNLNFYNIDCTNEKILKIGNFDIITIDNVIEHVESPSILISNLKKVLNTNGIIYLIIPNPYFIDTIKNDPHYRLFGISLLDKKDGDIMVKALTLCNSYDVNNYYHMYEISNYKAIFNKYDFDLSLSESLTPVINEHHKEYFYNFNFESLSTYFFNELKKLQNKLPHNLFDKLSYIINLYLKELKNDYKYVSNNFNNAVLKEFYSKYFEGCWYFILRNNDEKQ